MLSHGVIFDLGSAKVCSSDIIEIDFSNDKDIWIAVTDYYMYFYLIILHVLLLNSAISISTYTSINKTL